MFDSVPPELAIQVLISDALLVLSICSAKYWLLARGVGSLWLSINVLAGGGIGALLYLVIKGRFAVRGEFPVCRIIIYSFKVLISTCSSGRHWPLPAGPCLPSKLRCFTA